MRLNVPLFRQRGARACLPACARMVLAFYEMQISEEELSRLTVVVVGYNEQFVYLNDPKFADAPQRVLWDDFLLAWKEFGQFAAVIRKSMEV